MSRVTGTQGSPLPDEKLDEIRARAEAATPGGWRCVSYASKGHEWWGTPEDRRRYSFVAFSRKRDEMYTTSALENADAAFIAHARTDVPFLLEALAAERADRERLRAALQRFDVDVAATDPCFFCGNGLDPSDHDYEGADCPVSTARAALRDTAP